MIYSLSINDSIETIYLNGSYEIRLELSQIYQILKIWEFGIFKIVGHNIYQKVEKSIANMNSLWKQNISKRISSTHHC